MKVFLFIAFAVILILGNAMILLHTAKKPKLPEAVEKKPAGDNGDAAC